MSWRELVWLVHLCAKISACVPSPRLLRNDEVERSLLRRAKWNTPVAQCRGVVDQCSSGSSRRVLAVLEYGLPQNLSACRASGVFCDQTSSDVVP